MLLHIGSDFASGLESSCFTGRTSNSHVWRSMSLATPNLPFHESDPKSLCPAAGEVVFVRSARQILETLDEDGCLDGLPFMPEMLAFCGRKFRIDRVANKACVNAEGIFIGSLSNCFVLAIPNRCDGSAHGGCQMGCKFLWRKEWLQDDSGSGIAADDAETDSVRDRLQASVHRSENRYRCQATELVNISTPTSAFQVGQYMKDVASGVPVKQVVRFVADLAIRKASGAVDHLSGPCVGRTPTESLGIEVGEKVRVKSIDEIRETLDAKGCNRGLWFDKDEMTPFCGKELVVSRVLNRLIDEKTGELKELKNPCIVLSETECSGVFRRFCSRGMLHFWREIWLERVEG